MIQIELAREDVISINADVLHFDLSHHKCLFYRTIARLSEQLELTIHDLFVQAGS